MKYLSNLHTHTQFCDGKSTMAEQAAHAAELGFVSLGFSPHSPLPYDNDWAMRESSYPAFFAEVARLKELYAGKTEIYAGLEWDADTPDLPAGLDFVIGAVHSLVKNGERFSVDYTRQMLFDVLVRLYGGDFIALCRDYFDAVVASSLRPQVQIVAHFDLVTKYNAGGVFIDETDPAYLRIATEALDRIFAARKDLIFEVNTGVMARAGKAFPYPSPMLMRAINERGGKFLLTCDCHRCAQMAVGYDTALSLLRALQAPEVLLFSGGNFRRFEL